MPAAYSSPRTSRTSRTTPSRSRRRSPTRCATSRSRSVSASRRREAGSARTSCARRSRRGWPQRRGPPMPDATKDLADKLRALGETMADLVEKAALRKTQTYRVRLGGKASNVVAELRLPAGLTDGEVEQL